MEATFNETTRGNLYQIDPRCVDVVAGFNVRKDFDIDELKEQIKQVGVLNPISVIPYKDENGNERYHLVDGERRLRATLAAIAEGCDIKRIKAIYIPKSEKEEDLLIQQMLRNEGKNFTEYECALMFARFRDKFGYTITEIANKFGKQQSFVSKCLGLLDLPTEVQSKLESNEISAGAVRDIVAQNKDDEKATIELVDSAIKDAKEKGKKTATTKNISPSVQVIHLIATAAKNLIKAEGMAFGCFDAETAGNIVELSKLAQTLETSLKEAK
jgi:ParB family chromosome partitioning protein